MLWATGLHAWAGGVVQVGGLGLRIKPENPYEDGSTGEFLKHMKRPKNAFDRWKVRPMPPRVNGD